MPGYRDYLVCLKSFLCQTVKGQKFGQFMPFPFLSTITPINKCIIEQLLCGWDYDYVYVDDPFTFPYVVKEVLFLPHTNKETEAQREIKYVTQLLSTEANI